VTPHMVIVPYCTDDSDTFSMILDVLSTCYACTYSIIHVVTCFLYDTCCDDMLSIICNNFGDVSTEVSSDVISTLS
jgi:hypothetical protein